VQLNESVKLPGIYELVYCPSADKFEDQTAAFDGYYDVSMSGKTLRMNQVIILKKRIYEAGEWPSYRKAVMAQNKFADEFIILKQTVSQ
jgi:hypothetical protein